MWAKTATVYINSPFLGTQQRCPITSIWGRQQSNITKPLPWKNYCLIAYTKEVIFCHLQWKKLDQEAGSYIKRIFLLFLSYFFLSSSLSYYQFAQVTYPPFRVHVTQHSYRWGWLSLSTGNWLREKEFQAVLQENPDLLFQPWPEK